MIVPGINATMAIASILSKVVQEKMVSREVICERIEPVWTQMKLYGMRPARIRGEGEILALERSCTSLRIGPVSRRSAHLYRDGTINEVLKLIYG